jgi:hypothetical protein
MLIKVVAELAGSNQEGIEELLHMWVPSLGV